MSARILLVVAALLLAGCVESPSPTPAGSASEPAPAKPAQFSEETGAIEGVVLTEETVPVRGANLALAKTEHLATTDGEGRFSFSHVGPGTHHLIVAALGYESLVRPIDVRVGETTIVTLVVFQVAVATPHTRTLTFNGHWSCTIVLAQVLQHCSQATGEAYVAGWSGYALEGNATAHMGEIAWKPTSAFTQPSEVLLRYHTKDDAAAPNYHNHGTYRSKSPARFVLHPDERFPDGVHNLPDDAVVGAITTYPIGFVGAAGMYGVGVVLQQRFVYYLTTFHAMPVPDGFTAIPDG